MGKVHPSFDIEQGVWFIDDLEAPTLKALKELLPKQTKIIGYYPNGYTTMPWPKGSGLIKGRLPVSASTIWVRGAKLPKQPERPNEMKSEPRKLPQRKIYKPAPTLPKSNSIQWQGWNETSTALLRKHYADGLTAGQIAAVFRCTRNTICGKLTRMGLSRTGALTPDEIRARHK